MNKTLLITAFTFCTMMASCTSKTPTNQKEDSSLDSLLVQSMNKELNSDSSKVIYYVSNGEIYRSEFYNTTQALVREAMNVPSINKNYQKFQISYYCKEGFPTMDELQNFMKELMDNSDFWDTVGSELIDDLYYLSIDTKYEHIYHPNTSKVELVHFITQYEKHHHLISQAEFNHLMNK